MNSKKPLIQSLERAIDILELIRDNSNSIRATDVADHLGLGVATAHNIIRTLYARGYLAQDENNRYLLGPECFKLFNNAGSSFEDLRRIVEGPVREIAQETGDTTFFGSEYYGSLYCVSIATGSGQIVVSAAQEWLEKLHSTGAGKIIIAQKGIDWYKKICTKNPPEKFTPKTIISISEMEREIKLIKTKGYSISKGECSEEVAALGIPVFSSNGKFIGSLAQSFASFYLDTKKIDINERVKLLNSWAETIGNEF